MSNNNEMITDPDVEKFSRTLDDGTSGPELDYDNRWLAFLTAKDGKPETQFNPYEPPNWQKAIELIRELLDESRDIRLAIALLQAKLNIDGFKSLPDSLRLIKNMIQSQWASLNPRLDPDDSDPYGRLNALDDLAMSTTSCFRDFRNSVVISHPQIGKICVRHFEYALDRSPAPEGEEVPTRVQIESFLNSGLVDVEQLLKSMDQVRSLLSEIPEALSVHGVESYRHPDFSEVQQCIKNIAVFVGTSTGGTVNNEIVDGTETLGTSSEITDKSNIAKQSGGVMQVNNRADAVRAIDLVCTYLDREEPTNPASLLLKRARRLIDKDFIELMKDLAPEAAQEVARVLGVDLSSYEDNY